MKHLDQVVFYISSYILLFIIAVSLQTITDLPTVFDLIIICAIAYIIIMHNQILARHVLGINWKSSTDKKLLKLIGFIAKITICLILVKMMILDLYQFVVIIYVIDFITLIRCYRSLYNIITFTMFEGE